MNYRVPHGTNHGDVAFEDLGHLQNKLQKENFYGTIIQKWENGQVVLVEVVQKFKPKNFTNIKVRFDL